MRPASPHARVTCDLAIDGELLRAHYQLLNAGDEKVYVFDDLGRSESANLQCDAGEGVLHLLVGVPPLPPFPTYWMFHPKATALEPGATLHRQLALELPLREWSAYYGPRYDEHTRVSVLRAVLAVDFVRASRATLGPDGEPRGELESALCDAPLPAGVHVLRRHDPFDRI